VTLPLPLRNRLAELILASFHDEDARRGLEAVAAVCDDARALRGRADVPATFPADLFEPHGGGLALKSGLRAYRPDLCERARRGWQVVRERPLDPKDPTLERALAAAALLFDARLYFEVHEYLEPCWMRAEREERETLQGVIQVAVGFQHMANGNKAGASLLLHDGCARLLGRTITGLDLDVFGRGVKRCWEAVVALDPRATERFDWASVPPFPRRG